MMSRGQRTNSKMLPKLLVSKARAKQQVQRQLSKGYGIRNLAISSEQDLKDASSQESKWSSYCGELLARLFSTQSIAEEFEVHDSVGFVPFNATLSRRVELFRNDMDDRINSLESIKERLPLLSEYKRKPHSSAVPKRKASFGRRVFIVHGHDEAAKESVARFIERLGLNVTILHEQPNAGRTIIEKFEDYSNVGFAVILLTPDDYGAPRDNSNPSRWRARQNVILEMGYFMGKLRRGRVCALYKEDVEIPSDYQGVLYIPMDSAGAWQTQLAKEIKNAGIDVDLNKL